MQVPAELGARTLAGEAIQRIGWLGRVDGVRCGQWF